MEDEPIIAPSALKHGITEEQILHAYHHPLRMWDVGDGFFMVLGPDATALFLEVGYIESRYTHVIVHAMRARRKFLDAWR